MGWSDDLSKKPTGYWMAWQEGLKSNPPKFKAKNARDARAQYKSKYGFDADYVEQELN